MHLRPGALLDINFEVQQSASSRIRFHSSKYDTVRAKHDVSDSDVSSSQDDSPQAAERGVSSRDQPS